MGTFYNPVPPIVSRTGAQPYAENKLPPSTLLVPNPPFVNEGRFPGATPNVIIAAWQPIDILPTLPRHVVQPGAASQVQVPITPRWLSSVLSAWQPDPSLYTFIGGQQPFDSRNVNAAFEAVPVNNPPGLAVPAFVLLDDPLPILPRYVVQPFIAVLVPFTRTWLTSVLAWQPPDPLPQQKGKLSPGIPGQSVDQPPRLRQQQLPYPLDPPAVQLPRYLVPQQAVVRGQVPFTPKWLSIVLGTWQLPDPLPVQKGNLNPSITVVQVNSPPSLAVPKIVALDDPLPTLARKLNPAIFVLPPIVNNPPFGAKPFGSWGWGAATVSTQTSGNLVQSVDNPPRFRFDLTSTLDAWIPRDPLPTLQRYVSPPTPIPPVVNNPPGLVVPKFVELPDPPPQQARKLNSALLAVRVDNPPRFRFDLTSTLQAWQPPDPLPIRPKVTPPPTPTPPVVNNPPGVRVPKFVELPDPLPTLAGKLNPSILNVPLVVNNPPFGSRGFNSWGWGAATVSTQTSGALVQSVDNPPKFRFDLTSTLQAWQPPDPLPTVRRFVPPPTATPAVVNQPPGLAVPKFIELPDPQPQQAGKLNPALLGVRVDNPPRLKFDLAGTLREWQPPDPLPTLPGKLNPSALAIRVDNPPRFRFDLTGTLVEWRPPDAQPQQQGKLNPAFTAVRVDNPPGLPNIPNIVVVDDPFIVQFHNPYVVQPGPVTARRPYSYISSCYIQ